MKAQSLKTRIAIVAIVLATLAITFSSCSHYGCPGLITKVQPVQKEVRS